MTSRRNGLSKVHDGKVDWCQLAWNNNNIKSVNILMLAAVEETRFSKTGAVRIHWSCPISFKTSTTELEKKKKSPWYWMRLRILCNIIYDWLFSVRGGKQERRKNFLLQSFCDDFYYGIYSTSLLPQRHVKDPGHSAKSAGRWQVTANHLCKPLTQRSRSGLLCRPLIV